MELTFEWDEKKARENYKKHKVSFEEGKTIFGDPFMLTWPDPDHSENERRYLSIGYSARGRVLLISHTDRESRVRLISCRRATVRERRVYEQENI